MRNIIVVVSLLLAMSVSASETRRYLVATRSVPAAVTVQSTMAEIGIKDPAVRERRRAVAMRAFTGFAVSLTEEEATTMARSRDVRWIEPVRTRHAFALRTDPPQSIPYGIDLIRARDAWAGRAEQSVHVAVVDSGIDRFHPELANVWAGGYNFVDDNEDPIEGSGHGTHVTGTIAAADNGIGVVGVAPNAWIWSLKVLNDRGDGTTEDVIRALDWVIEKKREIGGNWVVNLSLGAAEESAGEREAFARVAAAGILAVAASGNGSSEETIAPVAYPAAYPTVIAVGAVDASKKLGTFSNRGPELDLVAPGVGVQSTIPPDHGAIGSVSVSGGSHNAPPLEFAPYGEVTAAYVHCGLGAAHEIPAGVAGKIALIRRGEFTFAEKVANATRAGAVAVIVFNNTDDDADMNWTLSEEGDWPVVVGITKALGESLVQQNAGVVTVAIDKFGYALQNGTSMATPHVAGVAALIWRMAPNATAAEVRAAMIDTAEDLGAAGFDPAYGHGLVDALAAAKQLAPSAFDGSAGASTGRRTGRRGGS